MKEWDNLLFSVRRSIRYHSKRSAYFGFLTKLVTAVSLILGSGTVAVAMQSNKMLSMIFGVIISFASTISLVFGFSQKEQLHSELKRKFADMEKNMIKSENPNIEILNEKINERLSIETDEPEPVRTLDMICHNELVRSQGSGKLAKINWVRSLFCQIDLPFLKPELETHGIEEKI